MKRTYESALVLLSESKLGEALPLLTSVYQARASNAERSLLHILSTLIQLARESEAIPLLEDACVAYPENPKWHEALACILAKQGEFARALSLADRSLSLEPNNEALFINRTCWIASRCKDPVEVRRLFEVWGRRFMDPLAGKAVPFESMDLSRERKLKIGYVSGDLKNHSVRHFIEPFLRGHDRSRFEVHAFMTMEGDEVTEFLKPLVDLWHAVEGLDSAALFSLIRAIKIDILIDLSGHTDGARLEVFAMRAAPVQVTWFGFMQTLGMKAMDWRLTDFSCSPPGTDSHYSEKLYRLTCMVPYCPPVNCDTLHPSPYKSKGFVSMVSLNHSRKLSEQILTVWRDILLENQRCGLIVIGAYSDPDMSQAAIEPILSNIGFPMDRVAVTPRLTMLEFMNVASVADFALDSYPISGGTTTLHALWMGLPTLALNDPRLTAMGRSTALTLEGVKLGGCVAHSFCQYKDLAGQWINDPSTIDRLRDYCRPALQASPLMDYKSRVHELECAYQFMWEHFLDRSR